MGLTLSLPCRSTPRLLCTATKQKNSGQNLEDDTASSEQKADTPAATTEKLLAEEKVKLEEQLKETTVRLDSAGVHPNPGASCVPFSSGWKVSPQRKDLTSSGMSSSA